MSEPFNRRNQPPVWITTSWDDGYPLDTRLAELLDRYRIPGTFYVPIRSQLPVLEPKQIRDLARGFEIGGHTVNHLRLDAVSAECARNEIFQCKQALEEITGRPCTMFCPPGGRFRESHLSDIREAGYVGLRTVELMSVEYPVQRGGLAILPTTLQLYQHDAAAYFKNAVKRGRWGNLQTYLRHARGADLLPAAESMLQSLLRSGGVFHLWGHSWEIEHSRLWGVLEQILKHLDSYRDRCRFVSNAALCSNVNGSEGPAGEDASSVSHWQPPVSVPGADRTV